VKKLIFASNNPHKLDEVRAVLSNLHIEVLSMADIGCHDDIPETADTIIGNAILKAQYLHECYGVDCFSDDSGLEVAALGGAPGVYSARYAQKSGSTLTNIDLLLQNMTNANDRTAQFRTVVALIQNGKLHTFEGICMGQLQREKSSGTNGFGYDPIFIPNGYDQTFADMDTALKNRISHRYKAIQKMVNFLAK
jgi:XTP/dITP diphosphohydrolase